MTEFNWDDSAVLLLIEKYQENEPLRNPRHMDFKNRNKKNDAIRDVASVFNIASSEIERKLKNLSSHYFREKRKYEESKRSGSGREDVQCLKAHPHMPPAYAAGFQTTLKKQRQDGKSLRQMRQGGLKPGGISRRHVWMRL